MSTLHAALAELADRVSSYAPPFGYPADFWKQFADQELRPMLAAHPASEAGEVRLSGAEREKIASTLRWHFACHAAEPDKSYDSLGIENAILRVERIIAARLAEEVAGDE